MIAMYQKVKKVSDTIRIMERKGARRKANIKNINLNTTAPKEILPKIFEAAREIRTLGSLR